MQKKVTPSISGDPGANVANMSEQEALTSIVKGHDSMVAVLSSRTKNLQIVRALWTGGNVKVNFTFMQIKCVGHNFGNAATLILYP